MIPTDPQDDVATAMPDAAVSPDEVAADLSPGAQPEPEEETNEQWRLRFIEENQHLLPPRPERPPPPPPSPWDGPRSSWKVPDHLSLRHPKGGYMAMALMSRTMDDLDEVTKGERAATYEEVDTYLGHALIAEGLVPFTYTADEAIRWWKSGGYKVLAGSTPAAAILPGEFAKDGPLTELATPPNEPEQIGAQIQPALLATARPTNEAATSGRIAKPMLWPTVVFRTLPGHLSSGGEYPDDVHLLQAQFQRGRLGRGSFGAGTASRQAFIESLPPIQYLRANAYDHTTRQIALISPQASYSLQSPTFVPTFEQIRQRNEELVALRWRTVDHVVRHAFESHILGSRPSGSKPYGYAIREFPEIRTVQQFKSLIYEAIREPTQVRRLSNGRNAFWDAKTSTVVIINTKNPAQSSAFQPKQGVSYFLNTLK